MSQILSVLMRVSISNVENVDDLVEHYSNAKRLVESYKELGLEELDLPVPEELERKMHEIKSRITFLLEDNLSAKLKRLKIERENDLTARERRSKRDEEIERLEGLLKK